MTLANSMINTILPLAYYIQRNTIISSIPMGYGKYHDVNMFSQKVPHWQLVEVTL